MFVRSQSGTKFPVRGSPAPKKASFQVTVVNGGLTALGVADRADEPRHVPAERRLDRGLAVAEQVVGPAQPRVEVLAVRHVLRRREIARGHEVAGRQCEAGPSPLQVSYRRPRFSVSFLIDPLILRVEPEVVVCSRNSNGTAQSRTCSGTWLRKT